MKSAVSAHRLALTCTTCITCAGLLTADSAFAQTSTPGDQKPEEATAPPAAAYDLSAQISQYICRVFQDNEGNFWFGTNSDGAYRYDGKSLVHFTTEDGLAGQTVRSILQTADGAVWLGTQTGLSRYHLGVFTNFTAADGLSDDCAWCLMVDRAGTLWVGGPGGVCRYDGKSFVAFQIPSVEVEDETPSSGASLPMMVCTIFEDRDGNIWFGTTGQGARKYDGKSFTIYTTKDGLVGNDVTCICSDRRGRIWFGCDTGGLSCYDGTTFQNFTPENGLVNGRVYTSLEDKAGNLWFSTPEHGVSRYDGTSFTVFKENSGLVPNYWVQSIFEDKDGTLWLGCSGGVFRFDGTSFVNVTRNGPWK